jgi:hypothetical protein
METEVDVDNEKGGFGSQTPSQRRRKDDLESEDEVMRRYEEANRLLAELNMVRRRRWGEG